MSGDTAVARDRFEIRGHLGSGGNGVVHRAFDRVRGIEVAVKALVHNGGREIYRFKREFRALADLAHPNLVNLHELYTVDDQWLFTMELIDGVKFHDHVRPGRAPAGVADDAPTVTSATGKTPALSKTGVLDEARLRNALGQLADGLLALHGAGKVHRDIKPSNVLVERGGRVVILDFGLVADVDFMHVDRTHERAVVGTPAYMSPEQASDRELTAASDWYSVGVMLYEALTGRRTFEGNAETVLTRKQLLDPVRPRELDPHVAADLDELCMRLLSRAPAERPDGHAVLAALGRAPSMATQRILEQAARGPFVGRAAELAGLRDALAEARDGGMTCIVTGDSGMGKSALCRAFLDEVSVVARTGTSRTSNST
jgi:serine/threonine protein kinase